MKEKSDRTLHELELSRIRMFEKANPGLCDALHELTGTHGISAVLYALSANMKVLDWAGEPNRALFNKYAQRIKAAADEVESLAQNN